MKSKTAIIVSYRFLTRIIVDSYVADSGDIDKIVELSRDSILHKVNNELLDNFEEFDEDYDHPYTILEEKHELLSKMKSIDFGESMCDETKATVLDWVLENLKE